MIMLHTCVEHDPRRTSIDFGVKRLKDKVKYGLQALYCFCTITPFPLAYNDDTSHMCWTWPEEDLYWFWGQKVKGWGQFGLQTFYHFCSITLFLVAYIDYTSHRLTMTWGGPLLILGWKGQRSRSNLDFKLFTVSARQLTYNDDTSHVYCTSLEQDPYWFWVEKVERSRSNLYFEIYIVSAQ